MVCSAYDQNPHETAGTAFASWVWRLGWLLGSRLCIKDRLGQAQLWGPCTLIWLLVSFDTCVSFIRLFAFWKPYTKSCTTRVTWWGCVSRVIPRGWQPFSGKPPWWLLLFQDAVFDACSHCMHKPDFTPAQLRARCCQTSVPSSYFQEIIVTSGVLQLHWGTNNEVVA